MRTVLLVAAVVIGVLTANAWAGTVRLNNSRAISSQPVAVDMAFLDRIRARLLAVHRYFADTLHVLDLLGQGDRNTAVAEAREAAQRLLPTTSSGTFSPMSALADLVSLLGFWATLLWFVLVLVREQRSFARIAEFLILGYCLIMLLMACLGLAFDHVPSLGLWVEILGIPLVVIALAVLFGWLFVLPPGRALVAMGLAIALSAGVERLLA